MAMTHSRSYYFHSKEILSHCRYHGNRRRHLLLTSAVSTSNRSTTCCGSCCCCCRRRRGRRFSSSTTSTAKITTTLLERYNVKTNLPDSLNVRLTVSDFFLRHEQLPFVYYFDSIIPSRLLLESFERTLQYFPSAGGRLSENHLHIECTEDDTVPLSIHRMDTCITEWLSCQRNHVHTVGATHPTLLPVFDPLFQHPKDTNLMTARITYFRDDATAIAVNCNHLLGDTASCIYFATNWGRSHRGLSVIEPCLNRALATTSGVLTEDLVDLMGITIPQSDSHMKRIIREWFPSTWYDQFPSADGDGGGDLSSDDALAIDKGSIDDLQVSKDDKTSHEYVRLALPLAVLDAMKTHGMKEQKPGLYISTNDMVMATAWLLKRILSKQLDWNLSVVMNLRGRCGVSAFREEPSKRPGAIATGLFGNGITNVIVELDPSVCDKTIGIQHVSKAARSIRKALIAGIADLPEQLANSQAGRPKASSGNSLSSAQVFSTTSWGQLSPWDIHFDENSILLDFHGQPSHPLPVGKTFSSVIHVEKDHDDGYALELFLPSDQVEEARRLHSDLCDLFVEWHASHNDKTTRPR